MEVNDINKPLKDLKERQSKFYNWSKVFLVISLLPLISILWAIGDMSTKHGKDVVFPLILFLILTPLFVLVSNIVGLGFALVGLLISSENRNNLLLLVGLHTLVLFLFWYI